MAAQTGGLLSFDPAAALKELETELKLQQTQLTAGIAEEQGRWTAFNARLDELERAFTKK